MGTADTETDKLQLQDSRDTASQAQHQFKAINCRNSRNQVPGTHRWGLEMCGPTTASSGTQGLAGSPWGAAHTWQLVYPLCALFLRLVS